MRDSFLNIIEFIRSKNNQMEITERTFAGKAT